MFGSCFIVCVSYLITNAILIALTLNAYNLWAISLFLDTIQTWKIESFVFGLTDNSIYYFHSLVFVNWKCWLLTRQCLSFGIEHFTRLSFKRRQHNYEPMFWKWQELRTKEMWIHYWISNGSKMSPHHILTWSMTIQMTILINCSHAMDIWCHSPKTH